MYHLPALVCRASLKRYLVYNKPSNLDLQPMDWSVHDLEESCCSDLGLRVQVLEILGPPGCSGFWVSLVSVLGHLIG